MRAWLTLALVLSFVDASRSHAQDASDPQPQAAPETPAVPAVLVVANATGRVPPELVDAVRARIAEALIPLAGARPVRTIGAEDPVGVAIAGCADDACVGAAIVSANAIGAVVVTLARRTARGPIALTLDIRDPISGAMRLPTQTLVFEPEAGLVALDPMIERLRPVMFSPPPPPPELLITVNVDGATVTIDGERVGVTPIAAARLAPGPHAVMVTAVGFMGARREVELDPGERERLDITLVASSAVPMDEVIVADGTVPTGNQWYEEWWVWTIVGGVVIVGAGVGIGVGVAASSGPPPDPMGIALPAIR